MGTGREEEFSRGTCIGIVAETESPKSTDKYWITRSVQQGALECPSQCIEGVYPAIAEVADQVLVREDPEIVRRQSDAPRRVQEIAVLQAEKELSIGIEDGDIAEAWAVLFVNLINNGDYLSTGSKGAFEKVRAVRSLGR